TPQAGQNSALRAGLTEPPKMCVILWDETPGSTPRPLRGLIYFRDTLRDREDAGPPGPECLSSPSWRITLPTLGRLYDRAERIDADAGQAYDVLSTARRAR